MHRQQTQQRLSQCKRNINTISIEARKKRGKEKEQVTGKKNLDTTKKWYQGMKEKRGKGISSFSRCTRGNCNIFPGKTMN